MLPIPLVAGNWKMNTTISEARSLSASLIEELNGLSGTEVVLCPPFVSLEPVADILRGSSLKVGAQNMHYEDNGAYTGEVSPHMLLGLCQFVILGHSERRTLFGETDEIVNRKVQKAFQSGLNVILCVGEGFEARQDGTEEAVVSHSLFASLKGIPFSKELVVAYEPIWAIGTGLAATSNEAQKMIAFIRGLLHHMYGSLGSTSVPIVYGGSVSDSNITDFVSEPDIDGALVGGASLKVEQFAQIAKITARIRNSS
jgi:triosephosphate isomerase